MHRLLPAGDGSGSDKSHDDGILGAGDPEFEQIVTPSDQAEPARKVAEGRIGAPVVDVLTYWWRRRLLRH